MKEFARKTRKSYLAEGVWHKRQERVVELKRFGRKDKKEADYWKARKLEEQRRCPKKMLVAVKT